MNQQKNKFGSPVPQNNRLFNKIATLSIKKACQNVFNSVTETGWGETLNHIDYMAPACHLGFNRDSSAGGQYHLDIVLFTKSNLDFDINNRMAARLTGRDIVLLVNMSEPVLKETKDSSTQDCEAYIYVMRVQFKAEITNRLRGKNILVLPVYGDPEEGTITKIVVEDEDEI